MLAIISKSISILSDAGLGMAMSSLGQIITRLYSSAFAMNYTMNATKSSPLYACLTYFYYFFIRICLFMALQPRIISCGNRVAAFSIAIRFLGCPAMIAAASIAVWLYGYNYPFTTRGILMGRFITNFECFQVTETPGLLTRHDGSLGSLSLVGSLCNSNASFDASDITTWTGNVTGHASKPHEKNLFLQNLSEEQDDLSSVSNSDDIESMTSQRHVQDMNRVE